MGCGLLAHLVQHDTLQRHGCARTAMPSHHNYLSGSCGILESARRRSFARIDSALDTRFFSQSPWASTKNEMRASTPFAYAHQTQRPRCTRLLASVRRRSLWVRASDPCGLTTPTRMQLSAHPRTVQRTAESDRPALGLNRTHTCILLGPLCRQLATIDWTVLYAAIGCSVLRRVQRPKNLRQWLICAGLFSATLVSSMRAFLYVSTETERPLAQPANRRPPARLAVCTHRSERPSLSVQSIACRALPCRAHA